MKENNDNISPLPPRGSPTGSPTPGTWSPARRRTSPSSRSPLRVSAHISWSIQSEGQTLFWFYRRRIFVLSYLLCQLNSQFPIMLRLFISNNLLVWSKKCFQLQVFWAGVLRVSSKLSLPTTKFHYTAIIISLMSYLEMASQSASCLNLVRCSWMSSLQWL